MDIAEIKRIIDTARPGYWYLASPYSKYPQGTEQAFKAICRIAAELIQAGVPVFCPIAHSHPLSANSDIVEHDYETWLGLDFHMMKHAVGIIVADMETWNTSYGVGVEIDYFTKAGKPVLHLEVPK